MDDNREDEYEYLKKYVDVHNLIIVFCLCERSVAIQNYIQLTWVASQLLAKTSLRF